MEQDICMKIADEISDKLIFLNEKEENKTILELYSELLESEYQKYYYDILTYIPKQLAAKGYEIVKSKYFELKKY